jgi:hypothetical protein
MRLESGSARRTDQNTVPWQPKALMIGTPARFSSIAAIAVTQRF